MPYQIVLPIFEIKPSRLSKVSLVLMYAGLVFLFSNRFFFEVELLYFIALGFLLPAVLIEISINKTKDAGLIYFDVS
ncbi:MAG: hypothetical protein EBU01_10435 [Crocinitomicaceae bacterium]|nr:hypothetical protein [Crocinitomicaceae bacterium]NCA19824.1 hypothetical protein [Crocinitomicaceae bacterium]